jgi:HK97 gp10 family phage protein
MPSEWDVKWKGEAVRALVRGAVSAGLEEVASLAVIDAKSNAPFEFGTLQGSIRHDGVKGAPRAEITWGSFDVNYALYQELGTQRMAARPYLRPAADRNYPKLGPSIRKRMGGV